jgi:hypothetical protein
MIGNEQKRGCIKSDFTFSKTYNLKVPTMIKPLNPLKGTSKPPLKGRFGGVK